MRLIAHNKMTIAGRVRHFVRAVVLLAHSGAHGVMRPTSRSKKFILTQAVRTISVCVMALLSATLCGAQPYFVSPAGNDANSGTLV